MGYVKGLKNAGRLYHNLKTRNNIIHFRILEIFITTRHAQVWSTTGIYALI